MRIRYVFQNGYIELLFSLAGQSDRHHSHPNPRDNNDLIAKIEELNISLASLRIENENLIAKAKELDVCNATISNLR